MKLIDKTLTSRITREKQWDSQSSTYDLSSRNKTKVSYNINLLNSEYCTINILNNKQIQKRFTDFDLLMHKEEFLGEGKLERLKFTNEKWKCRFRC